MKSFNSVYNESKKEVIAQRNALYESQKVAIVKVLKENYMITKPISELSKDMQNMLTKKLLEFWSPKTGINKAGARLLQENEMTLTPQSNKTDIKMYIERQCRKHLEAITEAYRRNDIKSITDAFKADIEPQICKTLKETYINDTIWPIISERIKLGLE